MTQVCRQIQIHDSFAESPVPEALCRAEIDRVSSGVTFGRADQLRRLLRWLGERSLAHPTLSPSEKEIAESVLGRADFDPQTDSLVRKEMSRLREKLSRYYMSEGDRNPLRISADGGYLLGFEWSGNISREGAKPCWLVLPFRAEAAMLDQAVWVLEELLMNLDEKGRFATIAPTTALSYKGRAGDVRQFAAECRADMVVEGSLRRRREAMEVSLWLVDCQTGVIRRSSRINGADTAELSRLASAWLSDEAE
jgi:TolB-like protein